ncbi:MAG TPA: redoxin domain-containing protein [Candidatus Tenderia electrophaga]|uniref:Redoxin domain-containing protein n=1 Tax=Candidatus Tenderia electrophaga TaxID=1748243 RepID=A0A832J813_9GAMM|nr:redoxin domain-containing protein [Candidatus Tenderia electrophaga]
MSRLLVTLTLLLPQLLLAAAPKPFVSGSMAEIQSSQGEAPMIVSFWSIDCPPCYKELLIWRNLSQRLPQLKLVLVSTDELDAQSEVVEVLQQKGVTGLGRGLETWQFADAHTQRLRYEIDKTWYGELPRSYFYSANGQVEAISGLLDQAKIEQWLAQFYPLTK